MRNGEWYWRDKGPETIEGQDTRCLLQSRLLLFKQHLRKNQTSPGQVFYFGVSRVHQLIMRTIGIIRTCPPAPVISTSTTTR